MPYLIANPVDKVSRDETPLENISAYILIGILSGFSDEMAL